MLRLQNQINSPFSYISLQRYRNIISSLSTSVSLKIIHQNIRTLVKINRIISTLYLEFNLSIKCTLQLEIHFLDLWIFSFHKRKRLYTWLCSQSAQMSKRFWSDAGSCGSEVLTFVSHVNFYNCRMNVTLMFGQVQKNEKKLNASFNNESTMIVTIKIRFFSCV